MIGFVVGFPAFGLMFWIAIRWFDVGQFAIPQSISVVLPWLLTLGSVGAWTAGLVGGWVAAKKHVSQT